MPDIVITEFMDEEAIRDGLDGFDVLYDPKLVDRPEDMARALGEARAVIVRNRTQVRVPFLASARTLEAVGRLGVGLDNIDMEACKARGIAVYPATGANDVSVAEYVIGAAMSLLRGAFHSTDDMISGAWPRNRLMGRETSGKRLGLVGFGAIARETAKRAIALGMKVGAYDPFVPSDSPAWSEHGQVTASDLDSVIETSDVISLHVPLTSATRNLIDADTIRRMKTNAIVINAARGGVVDEAALAESLKANRIGGAALDVFADEPLTAERAAIFAGCPNLLLTPHIAGVTEESNTRVSWVTVDNIRKHLRRD
jgi:(S)-sulfolactate dehydrogenase